MELYIYRLFLPTLSEEIIKQCWLDIQQHMDSIVPLDIGENSAEVIALHLSGQDSHAMVQQQALHNMMIIC